MLEFSRTALRVAIATSALAGLGQAIAAAQAQTNSPPISSADRSPALRLAQPRWLPLSGQQIKVLFEDRALAIDEGYEPYPGAKIEMLEAGGCWPAERFLASGQWQRFECQRGPRRITGHWYTEKFRGGERLCVEAPDFVKRCRFVWQGADANRVIMPYAGIRPSNSWDDPTWYNPYILARLSP
jgi:hypothetical protein